MLALLERARGETSGPRLTWIQSEWSRVGLSSDSWEGEILTSSPSPPHLSSFRDGVSNTLPLST